MVITLFLILKTGTQNWTPYHLTPYVKEGKIGLRALISSAHEKKIRDFMKAHPELELFSEIKEALGAGIDYYEIKLVHDLMEGE